MAQKCYVATFDKRINQYEELLKQIQHHKMYSELTNRDNSERLAHLEEENTQLKKYLGYINLYLDEVLETPGMSDEDLYNLKRDQKEVIEMLDELKEHNGKHHSNTGVTSNEKKMTIHIH